MYNKAYKNTYSHKNKVIIKRKSFTRKDKSVQLFVIQYGFILTNINNIYRKLTHAYRKMIGTCVVLLFNAIYLFFLLTFFL